jgi:DNA-binding PadR family transcriptional regulator
MNTLDREIMKAILIEEQSMYGIEQYLKKNGMKSNYATVWRHIKRMQKENILTVTKPPRKNGKLDKRKTEIPTLTPKGLATLMIEGDLQREELFSVGRKSFEKYFTKKLPNSAEPFMTDVFSDALLEMKPKVNLKFFDENWFREIYWISILESGKKAIKKYKEKFEKEGIWATDAELEKESAEDLDRLLNALKDLGCEIKEE